LTLIEFKEGVESEKVEKILKTCMANDHTALFLFKSPNTEIYELSRGRDLVARIEEVWTFDEWFEYEKKMLPLKAKNWDRDMELIREDPEGTAKHVLATTRLGGKPDSHEEHSKVAMFKFYAAFGGFESLVKVEVETPCQDVPTSGAKKEVCEDVKKEKKADQEGVKGDENREIKKADQKDVKEDEKKDVKEVTKRVVKKTTKKVARKAPRKAILPAKEREREKAEQRERERTVKVNAMIKEEFGLLVKTYYHARHELGKYLRVDNYLPLHVREMAQKEMEDDRARFTELYLEVKGQCKVKLVKQFLLVMFSDIWRYHGYDYPMFYAKHNTPTRNRYADFKAWTCHFKI
jgi:hypothetical protein